jgi:hypothetical protein
VEQVRAAALAGLLPQPVVVVLEGKSRDGVDAGVADGVSIVHASGSGDDALLTVIVDTTDHVTLVSADRALCRQAQALKADVVGPGWLLDVLDR